MRHNSQVITAYTGTGLSLVDQYVSATSRALPGSKLTYDAEEWCPSSMRTS